MAGQLDLGTRIVDSARGLTASTFTSKVGLEEAELRSLDALGVVGKRILPAQSSRRAVLPTDFSRRGTSFESQRNFRSTTAAWSRVAENEYQDFVASNGSGLGSLKTGKGVEDWIQPLGHGEVRSGWEMLWKHKQMADLSPVRSGTATPSSSVEDAEPSWERTSKGEVVFQEGRPEWKWRHEWRRIHKAQSKDADRGTIRSFNQGSFELDIADQMDSLHLYRSSALARLHQIRQHLTRSEPRRKELESWKEDWLEHQERCDWTVEKEEDGLQTAQRGQTEVEEPDRYYFHCAWRECHHRLLRQNENLSLEIRQRACVHDGCGYVSDTVNTWLRHITTPHHGLQSGQPSSEMKVRKEDRHGDCSCGNAHPESSETSR